MCTNKMFFFCLSFYFQHYPQEIRVKNRHSAASGADWRTSFRTRSIKVVIAVG